MVDDVRGMKREEQDENRPQEPSLPSHAENLEFLQKAVLELTQNMYPQSNKALRNQERLRCMITGTSTTDEELLNLSLQFTLHRRLPRTAQFALCEAVVTAATTDFSHSVDELLEQKQHDTRSVDESIYIPPWAGGVSPRRDQAPFEATKPRMTRAPVGLLPADPVAQGGDRDKHFHQLFHQLRIANSRSHRDVLGQALGQFDNLLGIRHERVEETEDVWQLFHRLRHKSIEDLHHGSKADEVENVLHGVPLDLLLWPKRLCQTDRALPPPGSPSYRLKSTGWGRGVFRTSRTPLSLPGLAFFGPPKKENQKKKIKNEKSKKK